MIIRQIQQRPERDFILQEINPMNHEDNLAYTNHVYAQLLLIFGYDLIYCEYCHVTGKLFNYLYHAFQ